MVLDLCHAGIDGTPPRPRLPWGSSDPEQQPRYPSTSFKWGEVTQVVDLVTAFNAPGIPKETAHKILDSSPQIGFGVYVGARSVQAIIFIPLSSILMVFTSVPKDADICTKPGWVQTAGLPVPEVTEVYIGTSTSVSRCSSWRLLKIELVFLKTK